MSRSGIEPGIFSRPVAVNVRIEARAADRGDVYAGGGVLEEEGPGRRRHEPLSPLEKR